MSDVGHPVLDFGVPYRGMLRLMPDRIPLGTLARLAWPLTPLLARVLSRRIAELGWHPGNADVPLMRTLMLTAVDDLPTSLLREFARWYDTKAMSDRYGMFDFTEHLERITAPILVIAGSHDALTPVRDLKRVYEGIASPDKAFRVIGRQHGDARDYSHADLILGLHAPDDVYPVILQWLEAHRRSARGRPAGRAIARRRTKPPRTGRSLAADTGPGEDQSDAPARA
jgi:hypothetical protein